MKVNKNLREKIKNENVKTNQHIQFPTSQKGITLIALVITIIVMLILVSVTISMAINGGLFEYAGRAVSETENAKKQEQGLADGDYIDKMVGEYTKNPNAGKYYGTTGDYQDGGKTAKIPGGFTVSGVPSESTIDGGLVIYLIPEGTTIDWTDETKVAEAQETYDQFVWIPIKNETDADAQDINDMFICQNKGQGSYGTDECTIKVIDNKATCTKHGNCTQMAGRLYADPSLSNGIYYGEIFNSELTNQTYPTDDNGLREPAVARTHDDNTTNLGQLNEILETKYSDSSEFFTDLQDDYNKIVKSVYENEGFWVGRYETSGMENSNTNSTVKVVAGTNDGISSVTWYRMYAQQKKYAENKNLGDNKDLGDYVISSMIQGAAYDQVMMFVDGGIRPDGNKYFVTEDGIGNVAHGSSQGITSLYKTGGREYPATATVPYNDCVRNIYDLEGNVIERTTAAYRSLQSCSSRGRVQPQLFCVELQLRLSNQQRRQPRFAPRTLYKINFSLFYINVGLSADSNVVAIAKPPVAWHRKLEIKKDFAVLSAKRGKIF